MDFIRVIRAGDKEEITINVDTIVSFRDKDDGTHISLKNQEYVETANQVAADIRRHLTIMGHNMIKVGE